MGSKTVSKKKTAKANASNPKGKAAPGKTPANSKKDPDKASKAGSSKRADLSSNAMSRAQLIARELKKSPGKKEVSVAKVVDKAIEKGSIKKVGAGKYVDER